MSNESSNYLEFFGARLRAERKAQGLTLAQLSRRTAEIGHKLHSSVLSEAENARREHLPSLTMLFTLSRALGMHVAEWFVARDIATVIRAQVKMGDAATLALIAQRLHDKAE